MPKATQDMTHAELVELSRTKARERDRLAAEAQANGCHATAMHHREIAGRYREEARMQEGAAPRRPGVRTAADKARACGEPTAAEVAKAGKRYVAAPVVKRSQSA